MVKSISKFPYPTAVEEKAFFEQTTKEIEEWWSQDRWNGIQRPYSAEKVAALRGTLPISYPSSVQADKLFNLLKTRASEGKPVHTLGSVDPVQQSQTAKNQEVVYVSGWACSSLLTTTNEVSPDFGDYPYDTVPNQVDRLFRAQQLHDKKSYYTWLTNGAQGERIDYLRPIIADADTGHGGTGAVQKLAKLFAERGAAAIHIEDQLHGGKKCGHLAGKVIVPTSQQISRLIATRLQWDIMNTNNLLIARSDQHSGKLLSSTVDPSDHEFVLGVSEPTEPLSDVLQRAEAEGATGEEIDILEAEWTKATKLVTFNEAVIQALEKNSKSDQIESYLSQAKGKSIFHSRNIAREILGGQEVFFDWEAPRTREGHYHTKCGIEPAVKRALAYAPYSDLIWLETSTPDLKEAQDFAAKIHEKYPGKWLVYNLSPSFNWTARGFSEDDLKNFIFDLAKSGFVLQLISLAGLHTNALATWKLSNAFKTDGMKAYVDLVQKEEKASGCDVLTHQKWSGADYYEAVLGAVQSGSSSTKALGKDSTENQF